MDLPSVSAPDDLARRSALARLAALDVPAGGLGKLAELGAWLAATRGTCPPPAPERARVVVVAGDHGVAEAGVSVHPAGSTSRQVAAVRAGSAPVAVVAEACGATVRVVDLALDAAPDTVLDAAADTGERHRVRRGNGRIDREDALTAEEAEQAFAAGRALVDEEVDAGADLLLPGSLGVGATTPAAVLVAMMTFTEPVAAIGRGSGIDDEGWMRKAAAIRDALRRARPYGRDVSTLLRVVGGADIAALAGFCVQAALRRTPVVLDGTVVTVAAMLAEELAPGAKAWWLLAQQPSDPTARLAADRLGLRPVLDLGIHLGDGTGAAALLPQLTTAARLLAG